MAYDTQELKERALKAIKEDELVFDSEVISYLGISVDTFYRHFPSDSEESKAIKKELQKNKIHEKKSQRRDWSSSNSPSLRIAYYKLLADEEEFSRLARSEIDHTSKDKPINIAPIQWVDESDKDT